MIERAEAFLNSGCCVNFIGLPRAELITILIDAHTALDDIDARRGLERAIRAMGVWKD
jgi:hypothetical protein